MAKKRTIVIFCIFCVFLVAFLIISMVLKENRVNRIENQTLIDEVEESFREHGIVQLGNIEEQEYNQLILDTYIDNHSCPHILNDISKKFGNRLILRKGADKGIDIFKENIGSPFVVLKGTDSDQRNIIDGIGACSGMILSSLICDLLEDPPDFCSNLKVEKNIRGMDARLGDVDDGACYDCCLITYESDKKSITKHWCGPPCNRKEDYIAGISKVAAKECLADSCKSDKNDMACCGPNNCVNNNKCYSLFDVDDVEGNGQKKVCLTYYNETLWMDPDQSNESCTKAGFYWFDCNKSECAHGVNSYDNKTYDKKNAFCCGDEESEQLIKCNGWFCGENDLSCCEANRCVYKGRCYPSGCAELADKNASRYAYCDGTTNSWIDLDENYCKECMGKKAWTGGICCGDDKNEGIYYNEFVFHNTTSAIHTGEYYCVDDKSKCSLPKNGNGSDKGCYFFSDPDSLLQGSYYCDNSEWYQLDSNEYYCMKCSFDWIPNEQECCGDDKDEYYIGGKDGTVACCEFETSCVTNGKCSICESCGNSLLEDKEQCEPPNYTNNIYCNQTTISCLGTKLSVRDKFGDCNNACGCINDLFTYQCVKGECGAECGFDDAGCRKGEFCNLTDCKCYKSVITTKNDLSENISEDCPSRVDINFNKQQYYIGNEFAAKITAYNLHNKIMPSIKFYLDILKDNEVIGSTAYSTGDEGIYAVTGTVTESMDSGTYKYVVRTYVTGCDVRVDSGIAEFIVKKEAHSKDTVQTAKKETRRIYRTIPPNLTEPPEKSECGNGIVEAGEVCDGSGICRHSAGCDYANQRYDIEEYCNNCDCGIDRWSERSDGLYCDSCEHCGDNAPNCNEACENGTISRGAICREGKLYKQVDICNNCNFFDNGIGSDMLIDDCYCDCQDNLKDNCLNNNYVAYPDDYYAGCSSGKCNECVCDDTYSKDVNNNGVDDKCGIELCGNKLDDNDNGVVDEKDCVWHYCSDCGHGLFNLCGEQQCSSLKQGCFFEELFFGYGICSPCSLLYVCEDYGYNANNCINDYCSLGKCSWDDAGDVCCTNTDEDKICDYNDNCPDIFNPLQENYDGDKKGDMCELCYKEAKLFFPTSQNESVCDDGIDDDCDDLTDCNDNDCLSLCLNLTKGIFNETEI